MTKLDIDPNASPYTEEVIPTDGVNVFVRFTNIDATSDRPYLYAWKYGGDPILGEFPGSQVTDAKYVSVVGNDNEKKEFYMYHFGNDVLSTGTLGIVLSKGDHGTQSQDF